MTVLLLVSAGPILTTVTELDWSPVVTFEPLLPPELADTVLELLMLPWVREKAPAVAGSTGMETAVRTGAKAALSPRAAASAGAVRSKNPAAANAREVRI